jgi:5'-nucleotidase
MKAKRYLMMLGLMLGLSLATASAQKDTKELWIYHTNDTHSRVEPLATYESDTLIAGKAGYVRRITLVKRLRTVHPDMLLFDCGDFSQGTPYYNLFQGTAEISLMNEMDYDAGTIGNHEFDFGMDNLARLFRMAKHPIVCSNYDFTGTPLEGLVKDYVVLERNGLKIGVFGLSPELKGLVAQFNCEGVVFKDPFVEAQRVADLLKNKEKCDVVICLSHLGWDMGIEISDENLIPRTRNIDLFISGHSHHFMDGPKWFKNLDGKEVPLQMMGKHGAFVGEYHVTLERE